MATGDYDRPREPLNIVAMCRYAGYAALIVAAFAAYFHAELWMRAAKGNKFDALFGSIGVLMLTAILPLLVVMVGKAWRDSDYSRLESIAAELYEMLHRHSELATSEVIRLMIGVYGAASGVNRRVGLFLLAGLSISLLTCGYTIDRLVGAHIFTRNQANLLILFMTLTSFASWCLVWVEDARRADGLDPSEVLASAMGRH